MGVCARGFFERDASRFDGRLSHHYLDTATCNVEASIHVLMFQMHVMGLQGPSLRKGLTTWVAPALTGGRGSLHRGPCGAVRTSQLYSSSFGLWFTVGPKPDQVACLSTFTWMKMRVRHPSRSRGRGLQCFPSASAWSVYKLLQCVAGAPCRVMAPSMGQHSDAGPGGGFALLHKYPKQRMTNSKAAAVRRWRALPCSGTHSRQEQCCYFPELQLHILCMCIATHAAKLKHSADPPPCIDSLKLSRPLPALQPTPWLQHKTLWLHQSAASADHLLAHARCAHGTRSTPPAQVHAGRTPFFLA